MLQFIKGERLHYFRVRPTPGILTAFYERKLGVLRSEVRVQLPSGALVRKIVHNDQIERPRADRKVNA